ncbi:MAG: hypothetical protein AB7U62_01240 [Pseudolabrys sp.]
MYYGIQLSLKLTNRDQLLLIDMARRQFDHLGRDGILAKRRQTNARFLKKGFLRFRLRSISQVKLVERRIKQLDEPAIQSVRFTKPGSYPY